MKIGGRNDRLCAFCLSAMTSDFDINDIMLFLRKKQR